MCRNEKDLKHYKIDASSVLKMKTNFRFSEKLKYMEPLRDRQTKKAVYNTTFLLTLFCGSADFRGLCLMFM